MTKLTGTILVVDDELDIREMIEVGLCAVGYKVLLAESGQRAIAVFEAHRVDLLICDIKMPGMNGIETMSRLREFRPALPIIVITGFLAPQTIQECEELGNISILRKPFPFKRLVETVKSTLQTARDRSLGQNA